MNPLKSEFSFDDGEKSPKIPKLRVSFEDTNDSEVALDPKLHKIINHLIKKCNNEYVNKLNSNIIEVKFEDYTLFLLRNGVVSTENQQLVTEDSVNDSTRADYDFKDDCGNVYLINEIRNLNPNDIYDCSTKSYVFSKNIVHCVQQEMQNNPLKCGAERHYKFTYHKTKVPNDETV
jgi:hypothetical protein